MDDLNHEVFTFGNPVETRPVERVMTGVEQIAALHAGIWGMSMADHSWLTPA